jgi:two-component system response regulator NreC
MPHGLQAAPRAQPHIRIVLADDHELVRRRLRHLLDREHGVQVIAEAGDIRAVIDHVTGHLPHVVVVDLSMPNGVSLDAIRALRERAPDTEIVVLTTDDDPVFADQALESGARGYVLKEHADTELVDAVRRAAVGESFTSPRVAAQLRALRRARTEGPLSVRELEILQLIALGYTSVEIGQSLHLSPRTVEAYRSRIHRKLGLTNRADLVRYALRRGLLGCP